MIRHDVRIDTASLPHTDTDGRLYLHSGTATRLDLGDPRLADPVAHDQAARWLRTLADEAATLAGVNEAKARHARNACPPVCDGCRRCRCHVDPATIVTGGTVDLCPDCAAEAARAGRTP